MACRTFHSHIFLSRDLHIPFGYEVTSYSFGGFCMGGCFECTGAYPCFYIWHAFLADVIQRVFSLGHGFIDFCAIKCFQLFISGIGSLLCIIYSIC